ncbi:MAG: SCO family protein [Candidatus Binataceae bacterium]|jgi:protein SCO1
MKPDRPGRRRIVAAAWIAAVAMLALAIPFAARAEFGKAGTQAASSPADGLPNISLVDQNGRAISLSSLKGRPALVAFIHTQCEGPCELITANMKRVARNLGPGFASEVTMVSITTEPKEDGSRELLAYAKAQGVNADGWVFLTGADAKIRRLLTLYGVAAEDDDSDHVLEMFLLSSNGAGMRRYRGVATAPETIASDIRKAALPH